MKNGASEVHMHEVSQRGVRCRKTRDNPPTRAMIRVFTIPRSCVESRTLSSNLVARVWPRLVIKRRAQAFINVTSRQRRSCLRRLRSGRLLIPRTRLVRRGENISGTMGIFELVRARVKLLTGMTFLDEILPRESERLFVSRNIG